MEREKKNTLASRYAMYCVNGNDTRKHFSKLDEVSKENNLKLILDLINGRKFLKPRFKWLYNQSWYQDDSSVL